MSPVGLSALLARIERTSDPNLLVGFETGDDAGVYRISADQAVVLTADFITPPVDDPRDFGRIAAANALSDVYAMGGRPLACLNLACFPSKRLGMDVLHQIMAGALEVVTEAGAVLAGGHTVEDEEPKFGLSVTGLVHPDRIWRNVGARIGDALLLTKPVGSGVVFNANRKGKVSREALAECVRQAATLNRRAAEVLASFEVHAATDVTGFGLLGHALGMADGSEGAFHFESSAIPVLPEAASSYERGFTTGANAPNLERVAASTRFATSLTRATRELLVDPQTSGGLLVALPGSRAAAALAALHDAGVARATLVGSVRELVGCERLVVT